MEVAISDWGRVQEALDLLDASPVECDGFVRLATTLLQEQGIPHRVMRGELSSPLGTIPLHFWIELDNQICDYRARMWLGKDSPHGIFHPSTGWNYQGEAVSLAPFPEGLFEILAGKPIDHYRSLKKVNS